jgi:glycine betaine/proline transport system permease protein
MPELLAQTFPELPVARWLRTFVDDVLVGILGPVWDTLGDLIRWMVSSLDTLLTGPPALVVILAFTLVGWLAGRWKLALFSFLAFAFIDAMGLFAPTMDSLSLVLVAAGFAAVVGVPFGIWAARNQTVSSVLRPVLDFMQTMPAFVYLLVAIILFSVGSPAGVIASFIFATPPAVRLTELGIRQVDAEVVEAARAFGARDRELLFQVQLPLARPTIMAGINQVIMLSLSMVVIAGLAGAGGVAAVIVAGVTRLQVGQGLAGGLAVVILAIYLDRVTAAFGTPVEGMRGGTA